MPAASRLAFFLVLCSLATAFAQSGRLEPSDRRLDGGEYVDVYEYAGLAGGTLSVDLRSDDFDVYLIVLAPDGSSLTQVDDTPGFGLNVNVTIDLPVDGTYLVAVTSVFADQTGAYELVMTGAGADEPAANPLAQQGAAANPLAPASTDPFAGAFSGDGLDLVLDVVAGQATGTLSVGGSSYDVSGTVQGNVLTGTFGDAGQRFDLLATLQGTELVVESGGGRYVLARRGAGAQAADPAAPNPLASGGQVTNQPAAAAAVPPTGTGPVLKPGPRADPPRPNGSPVPGIAPRAGFVTGTVFDTQGRPLAGAGVLITGTTYTQGQRTSFETVTGADGTYAVRVPDGRYGARAWIDAQYQGVSFSRILHPLSGNPNTEIDSEVGGNIDFQWVLTGLIAPPGDDASDYYGASIDLIYCGLPADAYCSFDYGAFPARRIAPGGSTVVVTLTPVAPLIDGSEGQVLTYRFAVQPQDAEYPHGGAPNAPAGFENGGGGRLVLGADWEYHSEYLHDIPVGVYDLSAVAILPDGNAQHLFVGLASDDVEHTSLRVSFTPWDDFSGRSYRAGGLNELDVYIRD